MMEEEAKHIISMHESEALKRYTLRRISNTRAMRERKIIFFDTISQKVIFIVIEIDIIMR
jgi:hypothetical protein